MRRGWLALALILQTGCPDGPASEGKVGGPEAATPPPAADPASSPAPEPPAEPLPAPPLPTSFDRAWEAPLVGSGLEYSLRSFTRRRGERIGETQEGKVRLVVAAVREGIVWILVTLQIGDEAPLQLKAAVRTIAWEADAPAADLEGLASEAQLTGKTLACRTEENNQWASDGPRKRWQRCVGEGLYLTGGLVRFDYSSSGFGGGMMNYGMTLEAVIPGSGEEGEVPDGALSLIGPEQWRREFREAGSFSKAVLRTHHQELRRGWILERELVRETLPEGKTKGLPFRGQRFGPETETTRWRHLGELVQEVGIGRLLGPYPDRDRKKATLRLKGKVVPVWKSKWRTVARDPGHPALDGLPWANRSGSLVYLDSYQRPYELVTWGQGRPD